MLTILLLSVTAAAEKAAPISLAAPGIRYANVDTATGDAYLDYFSQQLMVKGGIRVIARSEVESLLGLERQRQLLNCDEAAQSCVAELAGALGTDGVITGSLAKLGSNLVLNLKIVRANDASPIAIYSTRVPTDDAMLAYLDQASSDFASRFGARQTAPAATVAVDAPANPARTTLWIAPAVGAGVLLGGSLFFFSQASATHDRLVRHDASLDSVTALDAAVSQGKTQQLLGIALGGAAGAAAVVAGIFFMSGSPGAAVAVVPSQGGAAFALSGAF